MALGTVLRLDADFMGARCAVRGGGRTESVPPRRPGEVTRQPPRSALRAPFIAILVCAALPAQVMAQQGSVEASRPWFVTASHYGKWLALAGAGAMLAQGALRHRDADREFQVVVDRCRATPGICQKGPTGAYQNAEMETLYQRTVKLDHRARGWLLAGEGLLLGSGAMFLVDLIYRDDAPRNIPFTPFTVFAQPGKLGFSIEF